MQKYCATYEGLETVGIGGSGRVFKIDEDTVIKAMISEKLCADSQRELELQYRVWDSFRSISESLALATEPQALGILRLIRDYVKVSKPIESCQSEVKINGASYDCSFTMERLRGVPLKDFIEIFENYETNGSVFNLSDDYLETVGLDAEYMLHLSFNFESRAKFYAGNYGRKIIKPGEALRGFFISQDEQSVLEALMAKYKSQLTVQDLQIMIGFIYGWVYYVSGLVPKDIEITVGISNNDLVVNVLDFGMTIDLDNMANMERTLGNIDYEQIMNRTEPGESRDIEIHEKVIQDISVDLYACLDDPEEEYCALNAEGWNIAEAVSRSLNR